MVNINDIKALVVLFLNSIVFSIGQSPTTPGVTGLKLSVPTTPDLRAGESFMEEHCYSSQVSFHPTMLALFSKVIPMENGSLQLQKAGCNFNTMNMAVIHQIAHTCLNKAFLPQDVVNKHSADLGRDMAVILYPASPVSSVLFTLYLCHYFWLIICLDPSRSSRMGPH